MENQTLPSKFQNEERVELYFGESGKVSNCFVAGVRFMPSGKVKYDIEFCSPFGHTRFCNLDERFVSTPQGNGEAKPHFIKWTGQNIQEIADFSNQAVSTADDAIIVGNYPRGYAVRVELGETIHFNELGQIEVLKDPA